MPVEVLSRAQAGRQWLGLARSYGLGQALVIVFAVVVLQRLLPTTVRLPGTFAVVEVRTVSAVFGGFGLAVALGWMTVEPAAALAATSSRGWVAVRAIRLVLVAIGATAVAVLSPSAGTWAVSTTATWFLGAEALLCARALGTGLAWALPTAHLATALMFGADTDGSFRSWAWFLDPAATAGDLAFAACCLAVALPVWASGPARRVAEEMP